MSFQVNLPPSLVAKMSMEEKEVETGKPKREDWKKLKELEEARKAGTAPAMKDEEGKDINPHIPQYIMQAPWYYGSVEPTLKHQRVPGEEDKDEKLLDVTRFNNWYKKGVKAGAVSTKFRKGACENCGAMTHKKKDCLERPRKIGAKFTGDDIAPDEHVNSELSFDYDSKRDRWNGYDTTEHSRIVEEYAKIDEAKRQLKSNRLESDAQEGSRKLSEDLEVADSEDEEDDEDKYADHVDMPGQKFETKQRITVRNLRIREDRAKYLYNLDPNSAYYDPKTRSMRENPFQNTGKDDSEVTYAGDNFVRWSGDANNMAERQMFAWQAYEKGQEAHLQADPTKLELLNKEYKRKKEVFKDDQKQNILSKYGGEEHLEAPAKELLFAQTEHYVEYSRLGTVLKGQEKAKVKSRYEEDVYINNHHSVWGSFWKEGLWGFQCCHSLIKESYCTGEAGKKAFSKTEPVPQSVVPDERDERLQLQTIPVAEAAPSTSTLQQSTSTQLAAPDHVREETPDITKKKSKKEKRREKKKKRKEKKRRKKKKRKDSSSESSSSSSSSEDEGDEDAAREKRIKELMKKQAARDKEIDRLMKLDERKRPYNSMMDVHEPTEEEMEAFRRKRVRGDDPMAQFL